ncbi:MAG TPA: Holliday junction resolvase RuvX [Pyrinomonadaceae bacterium]
MTEAKAHDKNQKPIVALDLGTKFVGVAVSDARHITIKRLPPIKRSNWKRLLSEVENLIKNFDAEALVLGLPLRLDGDMGSSAMEIERLARNFSKSLWVPVYLQDERLTSFDARNRLVSEGHDEEEIRTLIDGEAAALILRDFLTSDTSYPALGNPARK